MALSFLILRIAIFLAEVADFRSENFGGTSSLNGFIPLLPRKHGNARKIPCSSVALIYSFSKGDIPVSECLEPLFRSNTGL